MSVRQSENVQKNWWHPCPVDIFLVIVIIIIIIIDNNNNNNYDDNKNSDNL